MRILAFATDRPPSKIHSVCLLSHPKKSQWTLVDPNKQGPAWASVDEVLHGLLYSKLVLLPVFRYTTSCRIYIINIIRPQVALLAWFGQFSPPHPDSKPMSPRPGWDGRCRPWAPWLFEGGGLVPPICALRTLCIPDCRATLRMDIGFYMGLIFWALLKSL